MSTISQSAPDPIIPEFVLGQEAHFMGEWDQEFRKVRGIRVDILEEKTEVSYLLPFDGGFRYLSSDQVFGTSDELVTWLGKDLQVKIKNMG